MNTQINTTMTREAFDTVRDQPTSTKRNDDVFQITTRDGAVQTWVWSPNDDVMILVPAAAA